MKLLFRIISILAFAAAVVSFHFGVGAFTGHPSNFVIAFNQNIISIFPSLSLNMPIYSISIFLFVLPIISIVLAMFFWVSSKEVNQ